MWPADVPNAKQQAVAILARAFRFQFCSAASAPATACEGSPSETQRRHLPIFKAMAKFLVAALALSATASVSAELPRSWLAQEPSSESMSLLQSTKLAVDEAKLNRSEKMEVKTAIVTALNTTATDTAGIVALEEHMTTMPSKDKVKLMVIELIPLVGCLGVDRIYLDCPISGLIKMGVCICTCFIGGVIWGAIDGIAILFNALTSQTVLNTLGMSADFSNSNIHAAKVPGRNYVYAPPHFWPEANC